MKLDFFLNKQFHFSRKILFRIWILALVIFPILVLYPISYRFIRLGIIFLGLVIFFGAIELFKNNQKFLISCISLSILIITFLLLPGRQISVETIRTAYTQELSQYEGIKYVWGGTSKIGIDCSGLVRQAMIETDFKQGLITLNPGLVRNAMALWWNPAAVNALMDGYNNYTRKLSKANSINKLDYHEIKPGDLAATASGIHILAYLGNQTWIEADPVIHKVIKVKIPEPNNQWFNIPVYILEWQQFSS